MSLVGSLAAGFLGPWPGSLKDPERQVDYRCMAEITGRRARARQAWRRVPLTAVIGLAPLVVAPPIGLALSSGADPRTSRLADGLGDVARKSGCRLHEYKSVRVTNPPVAGRMVERALAADGSHIGRRTPSVDATTHSLLRGRVLIQYRPGLPRSEVRALDRFVKDDPYAVLGFANQTGMTAPVAATAYLSLLTCPRVDATTLRALRAFRDRRRQFGNAF